MAHIFGEGFRRFALVGILTAGYLALVFTLAIRDGLTTDVKVLIAPVGSAFTLGVGVFLGQHGKPINGP